MNERILELAERATIQEGSHGAFGEPTINEYVDLEKFAELIVQECVSFVAKRKYQAIDDCCHVDEAMSVAEMDLLEHFGVE